MITAKSVKELREMTGAGMMDCKKALVQTEGDIEKAVEYLREKGLAAAAKKAGRVAAEGIVKTFVSADKKTAGMVEVNCETDFVAANEEFVSFADKVAEMVANTSAANVEELLAEKFDGEATVQEALTALIAKLGENMTLRRFAKFNIEKGAMNCEIGGWKEGFDPFYGAPAMLIVLAKKERPTYVYDGSLVMGNLMLAAHELGIGSCWIHRAKEEFESDWGRNLLRSLGVNGDYEGIGHCALGYADGDYPAAPARNEGRVFYVK